MSTLPMGNVPMGTIIAFVLDNKNIPLGWLLCDGSNIPSKYTALISALNANKTPNLAGRTFIGTGNAVSGSTYHLGETGGQEQHSLTIEEMPSHGHQIGCDITRGWDQNGIVSILPSDRNAGGYYESQPQGSNSPHNNMQPYQAVHYIIYTGQNN